MIIILTWLLLLILILILIILFIFFCYSMSAGLFSVPYVPTSSCDLDLVLAKANLKKGQKFIDLGSGDGRLVIKAVKDYQVQGVGLEINPILVLFAKLQTKLLHLDQAIFLRQDLFSYSLKDADVIYLFFLPKFMERISQKIKKEAKKNTIIISRGFELPGFKKIDHLPTKTFETYFYKT